MTSFPFPINIVKHTNGNVLFFDDNTGDFLISLSKDIVKIDCNDLNFVKIILDNTSVEYLDPDLIVSTQVLPNAPIPFSGDCLALATLLATDFFFEVIIIDASDVNYDNSISGLTSTNVQDAIDELTNNINSQNLENVLSIGNSAGIYDIDLNDNDIYNVDKLDFNTSTIDIAGEGQFVWNDKDGTIDLGLKGGNATLNIGMESIARVVNKTTPLVNLLRSNYNAVVVTGATGQRLSVKLAKADSDINSAGTIGLVTEDIAVNQEGFITTVGLIKDVNTTGSLQGETWNDGDILYLSPTVFGGLTNIKPIAPNHLVIIGYVEYAHAIHGKIYVKIDNGYELNELHDVAYPTTPANNEILQYNLSNLRWENKTLTASSINYSNTNSKLIATNVQNSIDEVNSFYYGVGTMQQFAGYKGWSGISLSANTWNVTPLEVMATTKVSDLNWVITSGAAGNSVFGLYEIGSNGEPSNLIFQTTAFSNAVASKLTYTFPSPLTIKKGIYALVHLTSSAISVRGVGVNSLPWMGLSPGLNFLDNLLQSWWGNYTYTATLPSTWPGAITKLVSGNNKFTLVGFTISA